MKLRKIMAGVVATALAASTLAVAASAACLTKVEGTESTLSTGTGLSLIHIYAIMAERQPVARYPVGCECVIAARSQPTENASSGSL